MKKTISLAFILALICVLTFTLIACDDKEDEVTIKSYEIQDLEVVEGDKLDTSKVVIVCHKSDDTTVEVKNNLVFDKTAIEEKLDDEDTLSNDSAGEYIVPVYHLDKHIGDLKVIVQVKR